MWFSRCKAEAQEDRYQNKSLSFQEDRFDNCRPRSCHWVEHGASSADLRFKVRGFSSGMMPSGLNPRARIEIVARTCGSRSAAFHPESGIAFSNPGMHIEGKWDAIDAQSAKPFLVLPANPAYSRILTTSNPRVSSPIHGVPG